MAAFIGDQYQEKYFEGIDIPNITKYVRYQIRFIIIDNDNIEKEEKERMFKNREESRESMKRNLKVATNNSVKVAKKTSSVRGYFISNFYNSLKRNVTNVTNYFKKANNSSIALFVSAHGEDQQITIINNILNNYSVPKSEENSIRTFVENSVNAVAVTPQVCAPMTNTILDDGVITNISSSRADLVLVQDLYKLFYKMYPSRKINDYIRLMLFTLARLLLRFQFELLHNEVVPILDWERRFIQNMEDGMIWKERIVHSVIMDRKYLLRPGPKEGDTDCFYGINVLDLRDTDGKVAKLDDGIPVLQLSGDIIGLNRILLPVGHIIHIQARDTIEMSGHETHYRFVEYINKILPGSYESNTIKRQIVFDVLAKITSSHEKGTPPNRIVRSYINLSDILVLCYCLNLQPYIFDPGCRPIENEPETRSGTPYGPVKPDEYFDTQETYTDTDPFLSQSSGGTKKNKSLHKRKLSKRKTRKLYRSQKHKQP